MIIIGVDYHPEFQQIALVDTDTGKFQEKRLVQPAEGGASSDDDNQPHCGAQL